MDRVTFSTPESSFPRIMALHWQVVVLRQVAAAQPGHLHRESVLAFACVVSLSLSKHVLWQSFPAKNTDPLFYIPLYHNILVDVSDIFYVFCSFGEGEGGVRGAGGGGVAFLLKIP